MTSANQSQMNRLNKEITDLRKAEAQEIRKEADVRAKINRAEESASRARNISTFQNKMKEAERGYKALADVRKKRAEIAAKIADKSKRLQTCEERQSREDEKQRRKVADEQKRLFREQKEYERSITHHTERLAGRFQIPSPDARSSEEYDFFISHASEDKDGFVRGLAEALRARNVRVWYDEFTLKVGDSLRRSIDRGLAESRFGVVIVSKHFFGKEWPQKELDALFSQEASGKTRILPIWHEISKDEVVEYSPLLADKVAFKTSMDSTDEIADGLYALVKNKEMDFWFEPVWAMSFMGAPRRRRRRDARPGPLRQAPVHRRRTRRSRRRPARARRDDLQRAPQRPRVPGQRPRRRLVVPARRRYQVLKKWISYRERAVLGRPLHPDEVQHFTDTRAPDHDDPAEQGNRGRMDSIMPGGC